MIRISPGDLVAVSANERFYYALVLSKVRMFGGHWTFAFHETSIRLLSPQDLFDSPRTGFHAFIDFIWSNREGRIQRLAKKVKTAPFDTVRYLKNCIQREQKPPYLWTIYDLNFNVQFRTKTLNADERTYPLCTRIDDILMTQWIDMKWTPDKDERLTEAGSHLQHPGLELLS